MFALRRRLLIAIIIIIIVVIATSIIIYFVVTNRPSQDTTPPTVSIISPQDGATVSGVVTVSFTAADESEINKYEILIAGTLYSTETDYLWNTTEEANGHYTILCRALDVQGNWGNASVTVFVNNTSTGQGGVTPDTSTAIKVMSYNIEESGANENWKQVVKEENPDILVLIETGTWDDNNNTILKEVVAEFNTYFLDELPYKGYCTQRISFSTDGEAILSRFPIKEFTQIPIVPLDNGSDYDVTHDFIDAVIDINGTDVHVIGAHLKSSAGETNEWRRERETEGIINYMDSLGDVPILYMGDLNSFSPDDTGDLAPSGDLGVGPMTMMIHPEDPVYGQYSSTVHTFTDVFRKLNPSDPGYTYGHQNPTYSSRIDFIIANQFFNNKLVNSTTGDTLTADTGSDHYSVDVFVSFNITETVDSEPPTRVGGLNATDVSFSHVVLTWDSNDEPDLSHYRVYRNGTVIAQIFETSYVDSGLSEMTEYVYEVSAIDKSLNEGERSIPLHVKTKGEGNASEVIINEFLPDPAVVYSDEWIELYNPLNMDANISGYILDDIPDGGSSPYEIPLGTIIPAKGYALFNRSITGIALNNDNDTVALIAPDGMTVIDSYSYVGTTDDFSIGRVSDGADTWKTFPIPTPGAPNADDFTADAVMINEFLPAPDTVYSDEWIELYNPLDETVDISGYMLDDAVNTGSAPYTIPAGTTIPAFGFALFNGSVTGIILNNAGDNVTFLRPDGVTIIDSSNYSSIPNDVSYGRVTDGNTTWTTFYSPTPGSSNEVSGTTADVVLINEFLPDPDTVYIEEWIELYNPTDEPLSLAGYILDDITGGGSSPYTIPPGTLIPAHGFALFNQSTTGIALNNAGDTVNFIAPNGTTILDSYTYSSSSNDVSYGRTTDGNSTWITFVTPTPGASNNGSTLFLAFNLQMHYDISQGQEPHILQWLLTDHRRLE